MPLTSSSVAAKQQLSIGIRRLLEKRDWKKKRRGELRARRELIGNNRKTHNPSVYCDCVRFTGLPRLAGSYSPISRGTDATLQFGVE